jgi:L-ascorbate metabolism protein UlaG (beta-lactamase superfamily)
MRLDYLAHSCFLLQHEGYRVLFDPYDPVIGYPPPKVHDPDLIVVSHDHHDHNAVGQINGRSTVVRGIAKRSYGPVTVSGSLGWHDDGDGAEPISLTLLEWAGKRLAHFGDLGCALDPEQEAAFEALDLLLMPCGGDYTLDGKKAARVVERLRPKVVAPMHYMTPFLNRGQFPNLETPDSFLAACKKFARVVTGRDGQAELDQVWSTARPDEIVVLHLQHQMA